MRVSVYFICTKEVPFRTSFIGLLWPGKSENFSRLEKSGDFSKSQRNSLILSKSVKNQEICESNALCKKYRQKQKEVENEQKNINDLQKKATLTNVNMDCFSLVEGQ